MRERVLQYGALKTQLSSQLNNIIVHDFYKKAGTQTVIYPKHLASGTLRYPVLLVT